MMDAVNEIDVEEVVYMTASQVGKTEILLNVICYHVAHDPTSIIVVFPTLEMGEDWSKDRFANTVRDSPALAGLVGDTKAKDSGSTIRHRTFYGGHLNVVGSNAPAGLSMRPCRLVVGDERDRFARSAGPEGAPWDLAKRRASNYWNRKYVSASTPTTKGDSAIDTAYEESDQRRYWVPCPYCGTEQVLKWTPDRHSDEWGAGGVVWDSDKNGRPLPETARYRCGECKEKIDESYKLEMLRRGRWIAKFPARKRIRGYAISAIYSPWVTWEEMVREWESKHKTPEKLRVFVNTFLGETFEEDPNAIDADTLKARLEDYPAPVPKGVGILVGAVDVQGDRLEVAIKGYGAEEESWLIEHLVLTGDPGYDAVWADLDRVLAGSWTHESGRKVSLAITVVDSGGHHTDRVYRYCAARMSRRIYAIKGAAGPRPIAGKPSRTERYNSRLYVLGVDTAKDQVFSRLKILPPGKEGESYAPGFMHMNVQTSDDYLAGLVSELPKRVWMRSRGGWARIWDKIPGVRNEPWDLEVYCLGALNILGAGVIRTLADRAAEWSNEPKLAERATLKVPARRRSGWVRGWER